MLNAGNSLLSVRRNISLNIMEDTMKLTDESQQQQTLQVEKILYKKP